MPPVTILAAPKNFIKYLFFSKVQDWEVTLNRGDVVTIIAKETGSFRGNVVGHHHDLDKQRSIALLRTDTVAHWGDDWVDVLKNNGWQLQEDEKIITKLAELYNLSKYI